MSFRIIQITDCHLFADKEKVVGDGIVSFNTLSSVLDDIGRYNPDLVIVTGDLSADESYESYQHFQGLWENTHSDTALAVIPGNHDDASRMKEAFKEAFWEDGTIKAEGWLLHGLHSQIPGQGKGSVSFEQLQKLQHKIDENRTVNHFVAVHHHPVPMQSWMDNYDWVNRESFVNLVERNQEIKIVVHGHIHTPRDIPLGNARLLSIPSTCWQFKHEPEFAFDEGAPGFRVIDLHANGSFDTQIIRVN